MNFLSIKNASLAALLTLAIAGCGQEQITSKPAKDTAPPSAITDPVKAQAQEKPLLQQKLEQALRCAIPPKPVDIVKALQAEKVIAVESSEGIDSISYFPTSKALEVWGLKVTHVHGFDFDQKVFWRGPGTRPLVTIGVVVPYKEEEVKQRLMHEGVAAATVENSVLEVLPDVKLKPPLTEIMCLEHQ